ncbi:MAG TPA: hypothetical protein VGC78_09335 [Gaiellaceae bacterium]
MHLPRSLSLVGLAAVVTFCIAGAAFARQSVHPASTPSIRVLRTTVDHYRSLTWTFQRAAHVRRTPTSYSDRRSRDVRYLRWTADTWTRRAYTARDVALRRVRRRFSVPIPRPPAPRSRLLARVAYSRRVALKLRRIYPGVVTHRFAVARRADDSATLVLWQQRLATAALAVMRHGYARPQLPPSLAAAFLCIHRYEGSWAANTGNGYYGGLQMDLGFQRLYGADYVARWGTADNWPAWAQLDAAARAYRSGRGFWPWPRTARACGLL